jgi:ribosome modulation factor
MAKAVKLACGSCVTRWMPKRRHAASRVRAAPAGRWRPPHRCASRRRTSGACGRGRPGEVMPFTSASARSEWLLGVGVRSERAQDSFHRPLLRSPLCGLSPWFAPVCDVDGGGGLHFGLVRRALCIFAPRSTPNELGLVAITLLSEGRVAAWPLAVAAEERHHAIHHCLGSRAANSCAS